MVDTLLSNRSVERNYVVGSTIGWWSGFPRAMFCAVRRGFKSTAHFRVNLKTSSLPRKSSCS